MSADFKTDPSMDGASSSPTTCPGFLETGIPPRPTTQAYDWRSNARVTPFDASLDQTAGSRAGRSERAFGRRCRAGDAFRPARDVLAWLYTLQTS